MIVGRNDPCPCGSGKKYKKCCTPKYDRPVAVAPDLSDRPIVLGTSRRKIQLPPLPELDLLIPPWLDAMSDEEIFAKLDELGIQTDREQFTDELIRTMDAAKVAEQWEERLAVPIEGRDRDFPFCASIQFSKRWAPQVYSIDKLDEMVYNLDDPDSEEDLEDKLGNYRLIWDRLNRTISSPKA